jgi:plasmid stability protein
MATLYVENVPRELYQALRKRARAHRKSMAAEVISLLARSIPTAGQLRRRRESYNQLAALRAGSQATAGSAEAEWQTAEEMVREDRER